VDMTESFTTCISNEVERKIKVLRIGDWMKIVTMTISGMLDILEMSSRYMCMCLCVKNNLFKKKKEKREIKKK